MSSVHYLSKDKKAKIDSYKESNILGLKAVDSKYIFLFLAALGIHNPQERPKGVPKEDFTRLEYLTKGEEEKAKMRVIYFDYLTQNNLEKLSDIDAAAEYCEKCAEGGFDILELMLEESGYDEARLERKMLRELDFLYSQYVDII